MSHEADHELAKHIDLVISFSIILMAQAHVEAEMLADYIIERNRQEIATQSK